VASAVVLMIFGCAYDNILLCLGGYSAFITLAILSFILAYAVKNRQVRELTKEKEKTIKKKSNVFAFERYFTKLLSKEVA
jgi:membrane protein implicated in regulation of membrane protease activity